MATTSSVRGGDSSRRYCQPRSSARLASTRTKPESVSRIAIRRLAESDMSLLWSGAGVGDAGGREGSHSRASVRDDFAGYPAFTGSSQPINAQITGFAISGGMVALMGAATNGSVLHAGELEIRPNEFLVLAAGRPLRLTVRELQLLTALASRSGRIVSRAELYAEVWGEP